MSAKGFTGIGTVFERKNPTTNQWEAISNINSISGPGASRETVDVTTLDSTGGYREFIGSLRDAGDMTLSMNFKRDTYLLMKEDFESDEIRDYRIILPEGTMFTFKGLVTEIPVEIPLDDKVTADVTIKISGKVEVVVYVQP